MADVNAIHIHPFFINRTTNTLPILIINPILGVFVNYVILTQSKTLGSFKYYLLNQTLWAQLFEALYTVYNPVLVCPVIGAFQSGLLRNVASPQLTTIVSIFVYIFFINTAFGVSLSLFNRLIFTFHPNLKPYLHNKFTFAGIVIFHLLMYSVVCILLSYALNDAEGMRKISLTESGDALRPFFNESSLIQVSEFGGWTRRAIATFFFLICLFNSILIGCVIVFIVNVRIHKQTSKTVSQNSFSLIISSLVQSILCVVLLFIPAGGLTFCWGFEIKNSANVINALFLLANIHGTIDMVCLLIFVKPYRMYCYKLFTRIGFARIQQNSVDNSLFMHSLFTTNLVRQNVSGATQ
uniref:G-protein coupled receptors family 1 profile domain-containing protein n=1 Tax=Panagrellus redivivus TaxID=6233 RepID=A0A7E4UUL8_PANRE